MTEAEQIMKQCQAGTRNYEEANNLHAACYGIIGRLLAQEPPKYSFKAHWEKDGRIGVVGTVVRPDGGVHVLQDTIDPPEQKPVARLIYKSEGSAGLPERFQEYKEKNT